MKQEPSIFQIHEGGAISYVSPATEVDRWVHSGPWTNFETTHHWFVADLELFPVELIDVVEKVMKE